MTLHLTQSFAAAPAGTHGSLTLTLNNLGDTSLQPTSFCYTSLARIDETTAVSGGTVVRNEGSFVAVVPDREVPPGGTWTLTLIGLIYGAQTRSQGILSAWVETASGATISATIDDLDTADGTAREPGKDWPAGQVDIPLGVSPGPRRSP